MKTDEPMRVASASTIRGALIVAALVSLFQTIVINQALGVLHIKATVLDADRKPIPVPRYALLVSDNPATAEPRRLLTGLDGSVTVQLPPGSYIVESDRPFALAGKGYQWTQLVDVSAARETTLELTAGNAEVGPLGAEAQKSAAPRIAAPSTVLEQWQESLVEIWTPTAHATAFVVDPKGLLVTAQRPIGAETTVEVQVDATVKVGARILTADANSDVAVLWIDPAALGSKRPVAIGCGQSPAVSKGQEIVALEAPLGHERDTASGSVESIVAHALLSDLTLDDGTDGGPAFTMEGTFLGMTSVVDSDRRRDFRVTRQEAVCDALAAAQTAMQNTPAPSAARLPMEPAKPYPVDTLDDAVARRTGNLNPYQIAASDFDISFLTPVLSYAAQDRLKKWSQPGSGTRGGAITVGRPPMDFANWSAYVDLLPPVLLVRVTPRLVEGFWAKVARGAAQTQGVSLPPLKRFRSGFSSLRAYCGESEVTPIHPFKLEHRISNSESIYEGMYVFDPSALTPECGTVKLTLYLAKEPTKGVTQIVDAKVMQQIWQDFAVYRGPK